MGYAIFTARKLMLTNRINQINFRIMQLSQQQQTLAKSAGDMERNLSWAKNLFGNIGNMFTQGLQSKMTAAAYGMAQGNNGTPTDELQQFLSGGYQALQQSTMMFSMVGQMMDMQSENQLRNVKDMENQIELERKSLETQVKALTAERESVEKAEDNEIKNSAPKFA